MNSLQSHRVTHTYRQRNPAAPERVFPLLCPVREAEWIPGWRYNLVYSESGVAELGCIFTTQDSPVEKRNDPSDWERHAAIARATAAPVTTWMCVDYDPAAFRIAYVWIKPGRVSADLRIQLVRDDKGLTQSHIRYQYTGLTPEGNLELESYDRAWFEAKMRGWETAINHYLTTGKRIAE